MHHHGSIDLLTHMGTSESLSTYTSVHMRTSKCDCDTRTIARARIACQPGRHQSLDPPPIHSRARGTPGRSYSRYPAWRPTHHHTLAPPANAAAKANFVAPPPPPIRPSVGRHPYREEALVPAAQGRGHARRTRSPSGCRPIGPAPRRAGRHKSGCQPTHMMSGPAALVLQG
jgi:hypothetical protein